MTKALTNYAAGRFADRMGRKRILVAGWLIATPVPFMLMWAPAWSWILGANALLGISQGLTWSLTVIMKIDLVGRDRRGLAMGLNEFAGYVAVAFAALATGWIAARYGLRPQPFYLGVGFVIIGLALSVFAVRETRDHVRLESELTAATVGNTPGDVAWRTTVGDRDLSAVTQAGFANNLNDGVAWGLLPLVFADGGMSLPQIGTLVAVYPAAWGIAQLATGALSDHVGRKWLIAGGMLVQAGALAGLASLSTFRGFVVSSVFLGIGTAMVYPTLLAAIGDVAAPEWRSAAVGVYRLWRDLGYVAGALVAGFAADSLGFSGALWIVAAITFASGAIVAIRLTETLRHAPVSA
jgi:MFS family permease